MDAFQFLGTNGIADQNYQSILSPDGWPLFFKDNLVIGNTASQVGICTLWAPTTKILSGIGKDQYCVAGNLYSRDGINYILRNVLANPRMRYILVCGPDRSGSGEALIKLAKNGVDENYRIKEDPAIIEREISKDAIQLFRDNVTVIDLREINDSLKIKEEIRRLPKDLPAFAAQPIVFPRSDPTCEIYPSEENGFVVRGPTVVEVWVRILATDNSIWSPGKNRIFVFSEGTIEYYLGCLCGRSRQHSVCRLVSFPARTTRGDTRLRS